MARKKKSDDQGQRATGTGIGQRAGEQRGTTQEAASATTSASDEGRSVAEQRTAEERRAAGEDAPGRPDPQRIAARAYELYLARGGGEGREMDDWLAAEGELTGNKRG